MNVILDGVEPFISESGIVLTTATTVYSSAGIYTIKTATYSFNSSYISDIYYQLADQSISVAESIKLTISPDLPCSSSGSTAITYSINNYELITAPSWVSIDSSTGLLSISTPSVDADTQFIFNVNSAISSSTGPVQKLIKLTVVNCSVAKCQKCTSSNGST